MKILVTIEQFNPEAKKILERLGEVEYRQGFLSDGEIIIVGLGLRIDKEVITAAPKLKLIATATTGLDHIDVGYAQEKGIKVVSLQGEDLKEITGTAELAFGLILSLMRRIPESFNDIKAGNWDRKKFLGNNLAGKMLGIIGLGRLGSIMAKYGQAFDMSVMAYDSRKEAVGNAQLVDFDTLLAKADIISIHAPLNGQTVNMFNESVFKKMKDSAYLINTARGAIVNETDLLAALESKIVAGYAADVLSGEVEFRKDASGHPLVKYAKIHDNIIITPHIGGYTVESRAMTDVIIAKKVHDLAKKDF